MALKVEERPKDALKGLIRDPLVDAILENIRREPARDSAQIEKALREIGELCARLPILDTRTPDEILGYGEDGLLT